MTLLFGYNAATDLRRGERINLSFLCSPFLNLSVKFWSAFAKIIITIKVAGYLLRDTVYSVIILNKEALSINMYCVV